jgi:hypothetical protein
MEALGGRGMSKELEQVIAQQNTVIIRLLKHINKLENILMENLIEPPTPLEVEE